MFILLWWNFSYVKSVGGWSNCLVLFLLFSGKVLIGGETAL